MRLILYIAKIPLGSSRHARLDTTRNVRRVEPMHFGCVELVKQHGSTRSTRRTRLAQYARLEELDWLDTSNVSSRVET